MKKLTIRQVRESLGKLDQVLAEEGEVTITRRGDEIARLIPLSGRKPMPSHAELRRSMPRLRRSSDRMIREDRDAR
jgi:prevent-host-death family protein